jgi:drug/metabolite transporter (DMT)-like permease
VGIRGEKGESSSRDVAWIMLGFAAVYLSWGTTYLATSIGVGQEHMPPAIFGGSRVTLAGCILLAYQWLVGTRLTIPRRELGWIALSGLLLFVGGNGLINVAQKTVESGRASILVATTPLWLALLEMLYPWGERLLARGWLGLFIGLCGVLLLQPAQISDYRGPLLALGSAFCWAIGSLVLRYHRPTASHLVVAAVQMIIGGGSLFLIGIALGELGELPNPIPPRAVGAYLYLLMVGSLVGFVAFNWLLGHVSATLVGTYAYVNPLIAVVVGWLFAKEEITAPMMAGMVVILLGVALVRGATRPSHKVFLRSAATGLTGYWNNPTAGAEKEDTPAEPEK